MSNDVGTTIDRLSEKFISFLEMQFADDDVFEAIKPLIPAVLDLARKEGMDRAEEVLEGLISDNSYEYWQSLIRSSSMEHRLLIMENARQNAISDGLKKIERDRRMKEWLRIGLKVLVSVLPVLL